MKRQIILYNSNKNFRKILAQTNKQKDGSRHITSAMSTAFLLRTLFSCMFILSPPWAAVETLPFPVPVWGLGPLLSTERGWEGPMLKEASAGFDSEDLSSGRLNLMSNSRILLFLFYCFYLFIYMDCLIHWPLKNQFQCKSLLFC